MSLLLHLKSLVATSFINVDGPCTQNISEHERSEGFTEVFGNTSAQSNSGDAKEVWRLEDYYVYRTRNANVHQALKDSPVVRVYQYRPSFSIQLVLRLTGTPHLVFNASNAYSESNGPLPTLVDLEKKAAVGSQDAQNRISGCINYLLQKQHMEHEHSDMNDYHKIHDLFELTNSQKAERSVLLSQYHELMIIQKCLLYGHNSTWDALYRKQCIKAHVHPHGEPNEMTSIGLHSNYRKTGFGVFSWFHIWAERIVAKQQIESDSIGRFLLDVDPTGVSDRNVNTQKAVALARQAYESLDWKIGQSANGTLLDSEDLSLIDILLFGHLAESLCNIHLVAILADYENLVLFFQNTYEKYFSKKYLRAKQSSAHWIKWNDNVNALNQFNRIPVNNVDQKIRENLLEGQQDAFKIMQSIALHCRDLKGLLDDAANMKKEEDALYGADSVPMSKKGRWLQTLRMGGDIDLKKVANEDDSDSKKHENDEFTQKKEAALNEALRKARQNDELWISATVCATLLSIALSLSVSSE